MFTGIVQTMAQIAWIKKSAHLMQYALTLPSSLPFDGQTGASISVNGVCQTIVHIEGNTIAFDAIGETLARTTIGSLEIGDQVNIERAAKIGDEIGGHLLSGHIIGTAMISSITELPDQRIVQFHCPAEWMKYILPKGFIALQGCSLTIVDTDPSGYFTVHLIPETLKRTVFGSLHVGDKVNLEIDSQTQAIVTTVENILKNR